MSQHAAAKGPTGSRLACHTRHQRLQYRYQPARTLR
jgi:hypothetical protein